MTRFILGPILKLFHKENSGEATGNDVKVTAMPRKILGKKN